MAHGASIAGEAGLGFVMRPGFMLPPLMFRDEQIDALVLGSRWVAQLPEAQLARSAADATAKMMAVLRIVCAAASKKPACSRCRRRSARNASCASSI